MTCNRRDFMGKMALGAAAALLPANGMQAFGQNNQTSPNIIVILSDDAGYADFGFHGSKEFQTPNLDQLASQALLCSAGYVSAPVCGPSRAGLLTGKHQQRFGFMENNVPGAIDKDAGLSGEAMGLPLDQKTIADHLQPLGYTSMVIGKWHQGHGLQFHPLKRGFDHFYGFLGGARSYFKIPQVNAENQLWEDDQKVPEPGGYLTDVLSDKACEFIEGHKEDPFFLYLAYNAPHTPLHAKEEDLARFSNLEGNRQRLAAMIWSMDEGIGRVLETLKAQGIEENTIVLFVNDNGGAGYAGADNSPYSGSKATHLEGGVRVPFLIKWPGVLSAGKTYARPVSTLDILPTMYAAAGGDANELSDLNGVNLRPYLTGKKGEESPHKVFFWRTDGPFAGVQYEDWKLVILPDRPAELYNIKNDPYETTNVARQYPEQYDALHKMIYEWKKTHRNAPLWKLQRKYVDMAIGFHDNYKKTR